MYLLLLCFTAAHLPATARANTISGLAYCNMSDTRVGNPRPEATPSGTECARVRARQPYPPRHGADLFLFYIHSRNHQHPLTTHPLA